MPAPEPDTAARRRLALMRPGWAYVIFDREIGALLCDGGWATRDGLGYYRATEAGIAVGGVRHGEMA
jgi:hypothetical protein